MGLSDHAAPAFVRMAAHPLRWRLLTELAGSDRLRGAGVPFRSDPVSGPGGRQVLVTDPAGNLIELFQPAGQTRTSPAGS